MNSLMVSVIVMSCLSCNISSFIPSKKSPASNAVTRNFLDLTLSRYKDCAAMQKDLSEWKELFESMRKQADRLNPCASDPRTCELESPVEAVTDASAGSKTGTNELESIANNQHDGVEESDFIKISSDHIFVLHGKKLEVIDRSQKSLLGTIDLEADFGFSVTHHGDSVTEFQMYVQSDRLIVSGSSENSDEHNVVIFKLKNKAMPTEVWRYSVKGYIVDTRMVNQYLYVVSNYHDSKLNQYLNQSESDVFPSKDGRLIDAGIECQNVIKPAEPEYTALISNIYRINTLADEEDVTSYHMLGATISKEIYMGPSQIVLFKRSSGLLVSKKNDLNLSSPNLPNESTIVTRIDYNSENGDIIGTGRIEVPGTPNKGQWSFHELESGYTAVVTTSSSPLKRDQAESVFENHEKGRNHLFVLEPKEGSLNLAAANINFGKPGEDVRSVRFVDDYAYVVTFEKTDPLYSFNLADPSQPKMEDALEVPGFSTYMHPIGEDLMVGLGYDALDQGNFSLFQGIQLSLFHTGGGKTLERIDNKIFGARGSYSDATSNHLAFYVSKSERVFGFPLVEIESDPEQSDPSFIPGISDSNSSKISFAGAILFSIKNESAEARIEEINRFDHSDIMSEECKKRIAGWRWWNDKAASHEINRLFKDGSDLITVSRYGLKFHDSSNAYVVSHKISFENDCT